MDLLTEMIPEELVNRTVDLLNNMDEITEICIQMENYLDQLITKCEQLILLHPENLVLKENHMRLITMSLTFIFGALI